MTRTITIKLTDISDADYLKLANLIWVMLDERHEAVVLADGGQAGALNQKWNDIAKADVWAPVTV